MEVFLCCLFTTCFILAKRENCSHVPLKKASVFRWPRDIHNLIENAVFWIAYSCGWKNLGFYLLEYEDIFFIPVTWHTSTGGGGKFVIPRFDPCSLQSYHNVIIRLKHLRPKYGSIVSYLWASGLEENFLANGFWWISVRENCRH